MCLCLDVNECNENEHSCHVQAECTNTIGSYICKCNKFHTGNGTFCTGRPVLKKMKYITEYRKVPNTRKYINKQS